MVNKNKKTSHETKTNLSKLENTQIKAQNSASITSVRTSNYASVATGLTPTRLAQILKDATTNNANKYLTLAEEMEERDTHYRAVLNTRKQQLTGLPITVRGVGDSTIEIEQTAFITTLVNSGSFKKMLFDLLDGLGKGYSVVEINYEYSSGKLVPKSYTHKPPQWFTFNEDNQLLLKIDDDKTTALPPFKTITHIPQLKTGSPIRGGLARASATIFILKNYGLKDWASFLEVFGMPLRLGKYGSEATEQDIKTLKTAIANLGIDAGAVIPESMQIEFVNAIASSGNNSQLYESFERYLDEQISKVILGQTMTTDNGSSLSQSQVHNSVRLDILKADAIDLAETINTQLIKPLIEINYGQQLVYPFIEFSINEAEDKQMLIDVYNKAYNMGVPLSLNDMRSKLDLPAPKDKSDTLILANTTPSANSYKKSLNFTYANMEKEEEQVEDVLASSWEKIMNPIVDSLNQAIDSSKNLTDLQQKLNQTNLNTTDFTEILTEESTKSFILGLKNGKEE